MMSELYAGLFESPAFPGSTERIRTFACPPFGEVWLDLEGTKASSLCMDPATARAIGENLIRQSMMVEEHEND